MCIKMRIVNWKITTNRSCQSKDIIRYIDTINRILQIVIIIIAWVVLFTLLHITHWCCWIVGHVFGRTWAAWFKWIIKYSRNESKCEQTCENVKYLTLFPSIYKPTKVYTFPYSNQLVHYWLYYIIIDAVTISHFPIDIYYV